MIVFSNLEFIFRFLPVFLIVYYLTPARYKDAVLFLGSIFVYAQADYKAAILLIIAVILNFAIGQIVYDDPKKDNEKNRKKRAKELCTVDNRNTYRI